MGIGIVDMVIIDMFKVVFFSRFPYMNSRVSPCKSPTVTVKEDKKTRRQWNCRFRILHVQRFTDTQGWMSKDPGHCAGHSEVIPMRLDQLPPPLLLSPHPAVSIAPHPTIPAIVSPPGGPPGLWSPRGPCEGSNESLAFDQLCNINWECETAVHVEMWGRASRVAWRPAQVEKLRPATVAFSGK